MRNIQLRLLAENPQYRRLWVQYSNVGGKYRVIITLFPQVGQYHMIFGTPQNLTYELINEILQNYLFNSK